MYIVAMLALCKPQKIMVGIKNRKLDPVRKEVALICELSLKVIIHCYLYPDIDVKSKVFTS